MATAAQLRTACVAAAKTHLNARAAVYGFEDITEAVSFALSNDQRFRRLGHEALHIRDHTFQIVRQALKDAVPANVPDATVFATNLLATFPAGRNKGTIEGDLE